MFMNKDQNLINEFAIKTLKEKYSMLCMRRYGVKDS